MSARRDLPLEEKLCIPVSDMPFSESAKKNLLRQGVDNLDKLVEKFHKEPGRFRIPFFSCKTFAEAGYLVVRMGFDTYEDYPSKGEHGCFVSAAVYYQSVALDNGIKEAIDRYVNENVSYSGKRFL